MVSWVKKKTYVVAAERNLWKLTEDRNVYESDPNEPLPNINSALMAHVAVYGIADFYDMENLRRYARKRFNAAAQYGWQSDGFVEVVKEVYRISIRPSDGADLRYVLCNYAMKHANQMLKLNNELSTDSQLQEFAAGMFQRMLLVDQLAHDRRMEDLRKEMIAHQKTKADYQEINETLVRSNDALRGLINAVPSLGGNCSNPRCGVEFPANVRLLCRGHGLDLRGNVIWKVCCWVCSTEIRQEVEEEGAILRPSGV